ncbi:MAG: DUF86 domain-containing protein [bacterium]|nr:DUF86 domain-containing protein [bacterium]
MSEIDKEFIRQKISQAEKYFEELKSFLKLSDSEISDDLKNRYALERVFLLLVEEMIDINNHLLKNLDVAVNDLRSSFGLLGEKGILEKEFAAKISPLTGVRNILVHQYEKINLELFLKNLRNNLDDFGKYFSSVIDFISK